MNDGTIESIVREMMPDFAKKILVAGNEDYTAFILEWDDEGRKGTNLIHLFDPEGNPISVFELDEEDVRRGVKVLTQMHNVWAKPNYHPTRVLTVDK